MRIEILSEAEDDLVAGAKFYERKRAGLGEYFLNSLYSDIDSLLLYAGIVGLAPRSALDHGTTSVD
jgi:hypothetical protein